MPSPQLEQAWAATEARQYGAGLIGPALGGILFSIGAALPFVGDAVSYGVSSVTSQALTGTSAPAPKRGTRKGLWAEAFEGLKVIWHDALLRAVIIQAPLINFVFNGVFFTMTLSLRDRPGRSRDRHRPGPVGDHGGRAPRRDRSPPGWSGGLSLSRLVVLVTGGGTALLRASRRSLMPSPLGGDPRRHARSSSRPTANAALFAAMLRRTPEELRGRVNNALIQAATALATLVAGGRGPPRRARLAVARDRRVRRAASAWRPSSVVLRGSATRNGSRRRGPRERGAPERRRRADGGLRRTSVRHRRNYH